MWKKPHSSDKAIPSWHADTDEKLILTKTNKQTNKQKAYKQSEQQSMLLAASCRIKIPSAERVSFKIEG